MLNIKSQLHHIILLFSCFMLLQTAQSQNIPDANFAAAIRQQCPTCIDASNNLTVSAKTVRSLFIEFNNIDNLSGIEGFTTLRRLNCEFNSLTNLPTLPNSLQDLNCSYNSLTSLPTLPNSLQDLNCSYNSLTSLPTLPSSLIQLDCSYNRLTSLPTLPNSLSLLDCSHNILNGLPALQAGLLYLYCHYNYIFQLPLMPLSLKELQIDYSFERPYIYCVPNNGNKALTVFNEKNIKSSYISCDNPALAPTFSTSKVNIACNGSSTGKIVVTKIGGTGATTYTISPQAGTQSPAGTFNNLPAGTYVIEAINDASCTVTSFTAKVTQPSAIVSTKCYSLVNKGSGKTLAVSTTGTTIVQQTASTGVNQKWRFTTVSTGIVKIVGQNNGRVVSNSGVDAANCTQATYSATTGNWKLECQSSGYYRITHNASGRALTVENASTLNNAPIEVKTWTGANSQLWQIVETICSATTYNSVASTNSNAAIEDEHTNLIEMETDNISLKTTPSVNFTIYPNPANNEAFVNLQGYEGQTLSVSIVDILGKTIHQEKVENTNATPYRLDLKAFASGLYFVKIQAANMPVQTIKLQVNKQ